MNAMARIRHKVFGVSQHEMARIAGVSQATISKWEAGTQVPLITALKNIRQSAIRDCKPWDDKWFFEEA